MALESTHVLESPVAAAPADAQIALREFFAAVLERDGRGELARIYEAFYFECHREYPPAPIKDWRDHTADGSLSPGPGIGITAANRQ